CTPLAPTGAPKACTVGWSDWLGAPLDTSALHVGVKRFRAGHSVGFVEAQRLDAVLIRVRVDRFLERLAQQVLPALGISQVLVDREHGSPPRSTRSATPD